MEKQKGTKGGRPDKGDDARLFPITVKISANDLKEIEEVKKLTNKTNSTIIYNRYKNNKFNIIDKSVYSTEHLRLFLIANNNLNQIAKQVNTHKQSNLHSDQMIMLEKIADLLLQIQPK